MASMTGHSTMADFTIVQALGKGSYGSVYKVKRKQDSQHYAIKEVNIKKLQPKEREDAVNEIRIMASIKHKNIVRYCDAFVERDNLYIAMEFAEHGDISRQIDKFKAANKYIKEETIWSYMIQMCNGLGLMHGRNVLHRDLKPKNVFLTGKNHVRLGDLGCAKLMKSGMARTQIGTPYYMSPEIWMNKPYDARSDVWALGCLVYELAMLSPPFLANDMNGLALKVKTAPAPRISKHYSEDLANLVASMLSKDPKGRPEIKTILASSAVQTRMHLIPPEEENSPWAGEEMQIKLINTIKVPAGFGGFGMYGGGRPGGAPNAGLLLPPACFPAAPGVAPAAVAAPSAAPATDAAAAAAAAAIAAPSSTEAAAAIPARRPLTSAVANYAIPPPPPMGAAPIKQQPAPAAAPSYYGAPKQPSTAAAPAPSAAAYQIPSRAAAPAAPSAVAAAPAAAPPAARPLYYGLPAPKALMPPSVAPPAAAYRPAPIMPSARPAAPAPAPTAAQKPSSAAYMYGLAAAAAVKPYARPVIVGGRPY